MAKQQKNEVSFEDVLARKCGLDINKKEIVATVSGTDLKKETRTFQSTTRSLTQLTCIFHTLGKKPLIDEWHTPAKAVFSFYDKSLQP